MFAKFGVVSFTRCGRQRRWSPFLFVVLLTFCGQDRAVTRARFCSAQILTHSQEPTGTRAIKSGERLQAEIKGGESQSFSFLLTAGQYVDISIEQHGSILLATLFDPAGQEVIQMDYLGGGHGPIYLSHIAASSGEYLLKILSINKWANAANYEVTLAALRSSAAADQSLVNSQLLFAKGRKNYGQGNVVAALTFYDAALSYWKASHNYHWQALTEYARSEAYRSFSRQKSEECLEETLRLLQLEMAPNDWRLKASALNDLGTIYTAVGEKEKALSVFGDALDLFASHQDQRGQASVLNNLARFHGRAGNLSMARELIDRALVFRRAENDKPGEINLLNALGGISDQLGEPEKALDYFTQALHGWEQMGQVGPANQSKIAVVLSNLATASDKLGRWDQALDYYEKALATYNLDDPNRVATLDNQGELYASLGNPVKAKESYDEGLEVLARGGKPDIDVKAGLLVHIGQLFLTEGDVLTAIKNFEEARSIQPGQPKLASVLTNLGAALALQGDQEKAMEAYQSALDIQVKLKDQRGQALTLQKRGEAHTLLGKTDEAFDDLNRALVFWKTVKDQRGEAATLDGIARVERQRGNLTAALANSGNAIKIIESLRTNISSRQLRTSYFGNQANYYELDVDLKMELSKADKRTEFLALAFESNERARSRVLLEALSEAVLDRSEFSRTSDPNLAGLIKQRLDLMARLAAKAEARTKLLSGAPSSEEIAIIDKQITSISEQSDQIESRLRSNSPRFASLTKPRPSSLQEIQQQLDADTLLLKYGLGEKRSYAWVVSKDSIVGFELAPRDMIEKLARKVTYDLTARNRDEPNESFSRKLLRIDLADKEYVEASTALSKLVLEPVASLLGKKRLVVVADGALQLVTFGALSAGAKSALTETAQFTSNRAIATNSRGARRSSVIDGAGPTPLIAEHEITYLPSASVLTLQRRELSTRKAAPLAVAVLADPVFDVEDIRVAESTGNSKRRRNVASPSVTVRPPSGPATTPRPKQKDSLSNSDSSKGDSALATALRDVGLDGNLRRLALSRQEALAITRVAPANQSFNALGFDASRKTATSPELSKYRIIHFATHGVLDLEHPELSGIVLSLVDEKGQPQDGYLRLHDIYNLNLPAELVVLSACQTGVGKQIKGEGLIALTRGFMYAGARSVVASLWKVDDAATSALMAEFYKQMFTNKLKPSAALREAQRTIARQKRWQSPYYWAGFFLQGDWN